MSAASLVLRQVKYQNKAFWRNPASAFFTFIFPLMFLVIFNLLFSRDQGLLKRIRGTPLPPAAYLAGRVLHAALIALLLVAIVTAAGALFYGVDLPTRTLPAFIVTLAVGAACFSALGLAMTAFIPNADASPAVVNGSILPLLFISDVFIPMQDAPSWLVTFADIFPVKHLSSALMKAFNPFETGSGFSGGDLAVMGLWTVGGLLVAARFFTWEPRK